MDLYIIKYLNGFIGQTNFFDRIIVFFAEYLGFFIIATTIAAAFKAREKDGFKMLAVSFSSAILSRFVFTEIIRFFYYRPRPFLVLELNQIISHAPTSSFPSGHAAFYFGLAFAVFLFRKKIGAWFLVAAALIGASRVAAGLHYPTDILTGVILGFISSLLMLFFFQQLYKNFYRKENLPR